MRRVALAAFAAVAAASACSLGLSESEVTGGAAGSRGSAHGGAGPGPGAGGNGSGAAGAGSGASTASTASGPGCGDGTCSATEDCSTCPVDCTCPANEGCMAGACAPCPPSWSTSVPATLAGRAITSQNGRIYAAPTFSGIGPGSELGALQIDACTGAFLQASTTGPGGRQAKGGSAAPTGSADLAAIVAGTYVPAGANPSAALVGGLVFGPGFAWTTPRDGSSGTDTVAGVAVAGDVWMLTGTRQSSSSNWVAFGDVGGVHACSAATTAPPHAFGAAMASSGADLYAASTDALGIHVNVYHAADCSPASCDCAPSSSIGPFSIGGATTALGAMLVVGGDLYLAGYESPDGSTFAAYVTAIDLASGTPLGSTYVDDATGTLDAFTALATDGVHLYAGGYRGAASDTDLSTASGVIVALSLDLTTTDYALHPSAGHAVTGLATDVLQPNALFAQIDADPGAVFVKCEAQANGCP